MKINFEPIREKAVPETWIVSYFDQEGELTEKEFQTVSLRGAEEESWRSYVEIKKLGQFFSAQRADA